MAKFKYKQSVLTTTEYVEALALYYFCDFNNLDFDKEIRKRPKESLNSFPDFVINGRNLEIVRAIGKVEGKQQKDIADVFGSRNPEESVRNKNNQLEKYRGENDHHIIFRDYHGALCAFPDLRNFDYPKEEIKKSISLKYNKYKNKKINKKTDLFVVTYGILDEELITAIFKWYKNDEASILFSFIYILFLSYEKESLLVAKMDRKRKIEKKMPTAVDKNKLADSIFDFKWLNRAEYIP